jgi:flagellar basal-body rod protein FlgB
MQLLERSLDVIAKRHQVLLANVANEETPGFKAKDLDFRETLAAVGGRGGGGPLRVSSPEAAPNPRHIPLPGGGPGGPPPTLVDFHSASGGLDGNTVSIEKTMAALNENSTLYAAASQILSKKYQGLIAAIRDSR